MNPQIACPLPNPSLTQIAKNILTSGRITRSDRQYFEAAMFSENPLSADEIARIREVFERLQKGWLRVVD